MTERYGDPVLDDVAFAAIAGLIHRAAGIALAPSKRPLVHARLARRVRAHGLPGFSAYVDLVCGSAGGDEMARMISALTTNVTGFFREAHHFEALRDHVLPPLVVRARASGRVRLWSAACSSGEEPLSLAMTLFDLCTDAADLDIRILATDIDRQILARAASGRFGDDSVAALSPRQRRTWLSPSGGGWTVLPKLIRPIRFRALNLAAADLPPTGSFDAILCRNVAIYFDRAAQERLWSNLTDRLIPGGYLFIGHSERISGPAAARLVAAGITTYRRAV